MGFWQTTDSRLRRYSSAQRRQYHQLMRDTELRKWHNHWITKKQLKIHWNWTDSAIAKYLGKPEVAGHNITGPILAYKVSDIKTIERTNRFRSWMNMRIYKQARRSNYEMTLSGLHEDSYASTLAARYIDSPWR